MVGWVDKAWGGNMDGEAGHEARGNILRYQTRRVHTGRKELVGRGGR